VPVKIFMPTPTSVSHWGYYKRWFIRFVKDLLRLGVSQVIGLLLALAILLLQIHGGLIPPNLSGPALESVLLPYLLVLVALLILSAAHAPVTLDRERAAELGVKENAIASVSGENAHLRLALEQATSPGMSPYEQAQDDLARAKLEGAKPAEIDALKFLLQHGGAEDRVVRSKGVEYFNGIARLMKLGLLNDEQRSGVRYWFVNSEFDSALKRILFERQR